MVIYLKPEQKAKRYTENLTAELQNSNENTTFSLSGSEQYGPEATLIG